MSLRQWELVRTLIFFVLFVVIEALIDDATVNKGFLLEITFAMIKFPFMLALAVLVVCWREPVKQAD